MMGNLTIETVGTEEEAAENLQVALNMDIKEAGEDVVEGKELCDGTQRALGDLESLTQDAEPIRTTLVDTRNGFNELSRMAMLWTVRHRWPEGARFTFSCYRHWAQLLLRHPGEPPVTIIILEGVTQGDTLSMVLYGITLVSLAEELRAVYPGLLPPFYADDAAFDGSVRRSE